VPNKRHTAAPETIEKLLEVFDSGDPQDQEALRQTLYRLHAVILGSREQLRRSLRSIPDDELQAAWQQAQADAALKEKEYTPLKEQLFLNFPSSPLPPATVTENTPAFTAVAEDSETFTTTRPVTVDEVFEFMRGQLEKRIITEEAITSSRATEKYLVTELAREEREVFAVLFLNTRHNPIAFEKLFYGTIDACSVHPREIVKRALQLNAAAVILAHNHPSGEAEPSTADHQITTKLVEALKNIDVRVLDHFIVAGAKTTSLAERGMM
jgi:DNA repair protein RadC